MLRRTRPKKEKAVHLSTNDLSPIKKPTHFFFASARKWSPFTRCRLHFSERFRKGRILFPGAAIFPIKNQPTMYRYGKGFSPCRFGSGPVHLTGALPVVSAFLKTPPFDRAYPVTTALCVQHRCYRPAKKLLFTRLSSSEHSGRAGGFTSDPGLCSAIFGRGIRRSLMSGTIANGVPPG